MLLSFFGTDAIISQLFKNKAKPRDLPSLYGEQRGPKTFGSTIIFPNDKYARDRSTYINFIYVFM